MSWRHVRQVSDQHLVEAIAAAAPNHCLDGWSYISRATSAFLAGDLHAARHLSYYAQLRAGLSMLGNLGIGVFNGINFAVDANGRIARLDPSRTQDKGLGTHQAVWTILSTWVAEPAAARQFLEMVRIGSSSLALCLDAIWPGTVAASVAGSLVDAWGIDLRRGKQDHRARNMSSYNPQAFEPQSDITIERLDFIEEVWTLFEPTSSSRFDLLDRHLLRSMLWRQHEILVPGSPKSAGAISRRYTELPDGVRGIASHEFLIGNEEPAEPGLLNLARATSSPSTAPEMLARGLLLLRAATAFTNSNFNDAGIRTGNGNLRPWIDPVAIARGFWEPASPLDDPADLWADVRLALDDLSASKAPAPASLNEWIRKASTGLPTIAEAERIGVWSLGS